MLTLPSSLLSRRFWTQHYRFRTLQRTLQRRPLTAVVLILMIVVNVIILRNNSHAYGNHISRQNSFVNVSQQYEPEKPNSDAGVMLHHLLHHRSTNSPPDRNHHRRSDTGPGVQKQRRHHVDSADWIKNNDHSVTSTSRQLIKNQSRYETFTKELGVHIDGGTTRRPDRVWSHVQHQNGNSEHILHRNGDNYSVAEKLVEVHTEFTAPHCRVSYNLKPGVHDVPPYKIYIYQLPGRLNSDLVDCIKSADQQLPCRSLDNCGMGVTLEDTKNTVGLNRKGGVSSSDSDSVALGEWVGVNLHDTWQFSLEVILHNKLLASTYRTMDPREASAFYVPYYSALDYFCHIHNTSLMRRSIDDLGQFLRKQPYFGKRPHVSTLGKIEREHAGVQCPYLNAHYTQQVAFIGIEKEQNPYFRRPPRNVSSRFIVAPYPSYVHHDSRQEKELYIQTRDVFMFMAAGTRRSNPFRVQIFKHFEGKQTGLSFEEHMNKMNVTFQDKVWLATPECQGNHRYTTVGWMRRAIFCLQPPGDSPTRKSFYDAVLSGCIPVLFRGKPLHTHVEYPFQDQLEYHQFTVTLDVSSVSTPNGIYEDLKTFTHSQIYSKQTALREAAPQLQYSYPFTDVPLRDDAFTGILRQIDNVFNLTKNAQDWKIPFLYHNQLNT